MTVYANGDGEMTGRRSTFSLVPIVALMCAAMYSSRSADVFDARAQVSGGATASFQNGAGVDVCRQQSVSSPILLFDAIERALCESPKTRSAWASIQAAAANLGMSKSAYLPTITAQAQYAYQHDVTQTYETPQLESNYTKGVNQETLSLGWVFYDFGARSSAVKSNQQLLFAARANQDATVQAVFASTAKDYFAAQASNANVLSRRHIETAAHQTLDAATARVAKGVAPITDQLQADTAFAQAIYERAKAEGDSRAANGAVAIDMSLSPDEILSIPDLDTGALPNTDFVSAVHDLLEEAKQTHPKILVAAAQWQAALDHVHFVRAQGLPVFKVVGESERSNQPVSASLGQPVLPAMTKENYIGFRIEIPLFDGFSRDYQIHQAEAQADVQEQGLRDAQQQVAIGIWISVQTLQTDTDNLRNTNAVLHSAQLTLDAAQHRYQSGVGNILELLSAQNTLASAEQLSIQAQLDWRTARLQLAASIGNLGMWAVR